MKSTRISSIDIMRGLTLFLMLFVNDLYTPNVPVWLVHSDADVDGMGLADWVFPGFLFMVGMAIPFAYKSRIKQGGGNQAFVKHVLLRTLSLLFIGVLMVNVERINEELTGLSGHVWAIGVYLCIFLIWNKYTEKEGTRLSRSLKALGVIGLIALLALYRPGTAESPEWIKTSWWGILGLIGWGYLVASLVYVFTQNRLYVVLLFWLFFVLLNALSLLGYTDFLSPLKPIFGVILGGNVASIVLAGLFTSVLLLQLKEQPKMLVRMLMVLGAVCLLLGFVLRNWFIISKIKATPSWAMICNGISILVFAMLYFLIDVLGKARWFKLFKPAGENSLTTYLAPNVIYYTIWSLGLNVLIYKQAESAWLVVLGSLLWAFAMIRFAVLLSKKNIRLKL